MLGLVELLRFGQDSLRVVLRDDHDAVFVDGDNVVIGAPGADQSGVDSGTAYVHHRIGTTWGSAIELIPHNHTIYNGSEVSSSTNEDLIPNATFRPS